MYKYATIVAAILQETFKGFEKQNFKINWYNPCVADRMINGKQHSVV